ncbi:MAG: hypothetical protein IJ657_06070 [Acidaminococcaceae bacterium]|nr:hypothetical protein [Acidaminococcaceae bacterium]
MIKVLSKPAVSTERKEATAITVMRCMLVSYANEKHIPFDQVISDFSRSKTYEDLFDFETEIWKEGPDYLRSLYEEEKQMSPPVLLQK